MNPDGDQTLLMKKMARHARGRIGMKDQAKKWLVKILLLVIIAAPLSIFYGIFMNYYKDRQVSNTAWISWYNDPQHEVYVTWETPFNETGVVHYSTQPGNLLISVPDPLSRQIHAVNLTGLSPDTEYYYEVDVAGGTYASGQFRTAPASHVPFIIVLTSDTQQKFGAGWHEHTASIFQAKNYSFIGMMGDFVEDGTKAEWNDYFATASPYLSKFPIVPVRGNHDKPRVINGKIEYYFQDYFPQTVDMVYNTNSYDTEKQFYFSFNWSSVHFQILNFPEMDIDEKNQPNGVSPQDYNKAFTPDQLSWIQQDLARAQGIPFRVTFFHCPMTGAGFFGPNFILEQQLLPILQQYNVTATVHGHAHHFERGTLVNETAYPHNPLSYFIVGCGGGEVDVGLHIVPETAVAIASPCYTELAATKNTMTFTTYTFEGTVVDNYTIHA